MIRIISANRNSGVRFAGAISSQRRERLKFFCIRAEANVAYRLAKYFRSHCKQLNIIIPMIAKSAATLLCLNADTIYMGEFAELGPLDAQLKDEIEKGFEFFS